MDRGEFPVRPVEKIPHLPHASFQETNLTETHEAILRFFRERGRKARATFADVAEATGLPHEEARRHVADLHKAGRIQAEGEHYWLA